MDPCGDYQKRRRSKARSFAIDDHGVRHYRPLVLWAVKKLCQYLLSAATKFDDRSGSLAALGGFASETGKRPELDMSAFRSAL